MQNNGNVVPDGTPEWVKEAQEQMEKEGRQIAGKGVDEASRREEISIKFGKGLVGQPFISKNGKELVEVKIPNTDPADKTPWASFVISPKMIHDNQYGKGVWMKLPADGSTRVSKPLNVGKDEKGKAIWRNDIQEVSNRDLKSLMESYKTKDRESVVGNLQKSKEQEALSSGKNAKARPRGGEER